MKHLSRQTPRLHLLALAACAFAAQAQQAAPQNQAPKADDGTLQTVTITATKRVQPLQSTPIAVSVITGGLLEEANLNNMSTIVQQLPTVNFRTNASNKDSSLFIRGVGTISTSPGVEPTVSLVLDGVVTARPGQATLDLVEVERIEVLRGPQGTVFGKNASAGVINIITRAPGKARAGYLDLGLYQGGERRVRAGISGELAPNMLRASLSVMDAKFDGNVTNLANNTTVNGYDRQGLRARFDLTPSKDLKIAFIADQSKSLDTTPTGVAVKTDVRSYPALTVTSNPLWAAAVAPVVPSATNRSINSEMLTRVSDKNSGLSMQVDYQMGNLQLTSITAQRKWTNTQFQDQDRLSTVYRQFAQTVDRGDLDFTQTSQELRVANTNRQFVDYVAGVFFMEGKNDEQYRRDVTRCAGSTATALASGLVPCSTGSITSDNGVANYGIRNESLALFGEGTFNFSQSLRAIAGVRYTQDDLSYYHSRTASAAGVPGVAASRARVDGSTRSTAWSGRFGPQWELNKDMMVYGTYSRGYKGPAYNVFFNMSPTQDNVLAPEVSDSYELGLKSELMNRRVRLNLAAFQTEYDGYQANVPDLVNGAIVTRLINAGKVSTKGVELDLTARVSNAFTVSGSVANIVARIKNFNCPPGAAASCNVNGKPLPFSPDWKASLRAKYSQPLGGKLGLEYAADYTWQSRVNFELTQQPDAFQAAYGIVNASLALTSDAGWRLALVGKNLADKSYSTLVQNNPGPAITRYVPRDDGRYFGVTFRYDF